MEKGLLVTTPVKKALLDLITEVYEGGFKGDIADAVEKKLVS